MTQSGESHAYTLDLCSDGFQLTSELLFATMLSLQMPKTSHWSWCLILTLFQVSNLHGTDITF